MDYPYLQVEAIEFNIAFDRWLLIMTPQGVVRMDLEKLLPRAAPLIIPESIRRRMSPSFPWTKASDLDEFEPPVWLDSSVTAGVLVS
jgi:hypothetical protein